MERDSVTFKNSGTSKIFFLLSIGILVYWSLGQVIDVYRFAVVGAIFEILWLFMILGLFVLPIWSTVYWVKEGFNFKSFYLYAAMVGITNILLMVLNRPAA